MLGTHALLGLGLALAGGCAAYSVTYRPHAYPVKMPEDTVLTSVGPVMVFNAQHSVDKVHVGVVGLKLVRANLRDWTHRAERLVIGELARHGINANLIHGGKRMNMAVIDAALTRAPGRDRGAVVTLEIELAEGTFRMFHGHGTSRDPWRAMDVSLTQAVRAMLLDPDVQDFLRRP